jgi:hypothetical protein
MPAPITNALVKIIKSMVKVMDAMLIVTKTAVFVIRGIDLFISRLINMKTGGTSPIIRS